MSKKKGAEVEENVEQVNGEQPDADGIETMDETAGGQRLIPTMEVKVVKKIVEFVRRHEDTKAEHKVLTERLTGENNEALMLYNKYKELFSEDEKGNWIYEANGARLEITKPGELKVKTKLVEVE